MKISLVPFFYLLVFCNGITQSAAQEIMHGQPKKPSELTDPAEIEIAKSLIGSYIKFKKIYGDCLKNKTSISKCMCNHSDAYEEYSKTYHDAITAGEFFRLNTFYFYDEGVKRTLNLSKISELEGDFSQYCRYDINREYTPLTEMEQPPLIIINKEEVKKVHALYLYQRKTSLAESFLDCPRQTEEEKKICNCRNLDAYEIMNAKAERVLEEHPEWKGRWLKYFWKGYEYGQTVSGYVRSYKSLKKYCRNKDG